MDLLHFVPSDLLVLAEGVAPITSSVATAVSRWATPEGITSLVGLGGFLCTAIALVLNLLGRKADAAKVLEIRDKLAANDAQLRTAATALGSVIRGVENAKKDAGADNVAFVTEAIRTIAKDAKVESVLKPLVKSVQAGNSDPAELLGVIKASMSAALDPAKPD